MQTGVNFIRIKDVLSATVADERALPGGITRDEYTAIEHGATKQVG